MIIWAGTSSDDVGMIVEHLPSVLVPKKSQEVQVVPGRNWNNVLEYGSFEDYEQPYSVFLDAKEIGGIQRVMPRVVDWLLGHEGYQRLEDTYFPDVYRKAYYSGGSEFLNIFGEYGEGTLTFVCAPAKYFKMGERPVQMTSGGKLFNPSAFAAHPTFVFEMSSPAGTGSITVNDSIVNIVSNGQSYEEGTVTVYLDTARHKAYTSGNLNLNNKISGDYEALKLGKTSVISYTGDVQNLRVIPNWWTV